MLHICHLIAPTQSDLSSLPNCISCGVLKFKSHLVISSKACRVFSLGASQLMPTAPGLHSGALQEVYGQLACLVVV